MAPKTIAKHSLKDKPSSGDLRGRLTIKKLFRSAWSFPFLLTVILLLFTALKISGSSLEVYRYILGQPQGRSLVANKPESIRSDEWLVNTQMAIAQHNNDYRIVNKNIGDGQNMSLLSGTPYRDWGTIFEPETWAYFIMPFNYAFAFSWWIIGYLLILSCYFFILAFWPKRYWSAAFLALALFFSPFVQWWYLFGTLASLYYPLFIGLLFVYLLRARKLRYQLWCAAGLIYSIVGFALVLYPPFMIACAFVIGLFGLGYLLERRRNQGLRSLLPPLGWLITAVIVSGLLTGAFLLTRHTAVHAITSTVYPGKRVESGGGVSVSRLFSGFLDVQLENVHRAVHYDLNQSEDANFLLVAPFLLLPSVYLLYKKFRSKRSVDWPLLLVSLVLIILILRSVSTILDPLLKPFLFTMVPAGRLLIAFGLVNVLQIIFYIRLADTMPDFKRWKVLLYSLVVLAVEAALALWTHHAFPGYVGTLKALLLAVPLPLVTYLLLRKKTALALGLFLIFSIYSTLHVNPLYHGTAPLTNTAITSQIKAIGSQSDGKWIAEGIYYENFPQMVGVPSLSGVYDYPQLPIWKSLPPHKPAIYNRYAHVVFVIDHSGTANYQTHLELEQGDSFVVVTEPCSSFLKENNVRFILAQAPIKNSCVQLESVVPYPNQTFFIYRINYL